MCVREGVGPSVELGKELSSSYLASPGFPSRGLVQDSSHSANCTWASLAPLFVVGVCIVFAGPMYVSLLRPVARVQSVRTWATS